MGPEQGRTELSCCFRGRYFLESSNWQLALFKLRSAFICEPQEYASYQ